jgi:rubrerythrin
MDIGSILLLLSLSILVVMFVARPLIEQKSSPVNQLEHERSHWLAERDRALTALQELDFDYALGKIPEEDYPATRAWMVQQGVEILRKLDELDSKDTDLQAADRIEAAIAARRLLQTEAAGKTAQPGADRPNRISTPDDELEARIAERSRQRNGKAAGFCHKCGSAVQKSDQFCPKCGTKLKAAE